MALRLQAFWNIRSLVLLSHRWQSSAATPLTEPLDNIPPSEPYRRPSPESVKVTKLNNGLTVASLETFSPVSEVGVIVRAGSRFETPKKEGITHLLRTCAYQSTPDKSAFRISREMEQLGGSMKCTVTREHATYTTNFIRGNLDTALETLGSVIKNTDFKRWEVADQKARMELDLAVLKTKPESMLMEDIHKYAFRSGLCNSVYSPSYNIHSLSHDDLNHFVKKNFTAKRMTLVGIGVNHDDLVSQANLSFGNVPSGSPADQPLAEYVGGGESRIASALPFGVAIIGCQGASICDDSKTVLTSGVLQHVLSGVCNIKWGSNASAGRLGKAIASAVDGPFTASAFHFGYSDNGLFGIYAMAHGKNMEAMLRAVFKEFKNVAVGSVDQDLPRAKNALKASILMTAEQQSQYLKDVGLQLSLRGSYTDPEEAVKIIDSISPQDVTSFARKILSTKSTLCCYGDISGVPRLDALLSELK